MVPNDLTTVAADQAAIQADLKNLFPGKGGGTGGGTGTGTTGTGTGTGTGTTGLARDDRDGNGHDRDRHRDDRSQTSPGPQGRQREACRRRDCKAPARQDSRPGQEALSRRAAVLLLDC